MAWHGMTWHDPLGCQSLAALPGAKPEKNHKLIAHHGEEPVIASTYQLLGSNQVITCKLSSQLLPVVAMLKVDSR